MASTTTNIKQQYYKRFGAAERMEHMALLVSFTMLVVTGLPQRYAEYQIAKDIITFLGGIESVRILHRFFAIILMITSIYHGGAVSYKIYVRGDRLSMLPTLKDLWDVIGVVMFNLGLRKEHPRMPRYNFGEKAEYLAVVWGTILMVITGFMMWNPVATTKYLSGAAIPIARVAHSSEALLATLAIIVWHMYNVHIKRFNRAMFTGKISREAMEEEHLEELEAIEQGNDKLQIPEEIYVQRLRRFGIYAIVVTLVLVGGLIWFVTFEDSAISTVPRQNVQIFAPQVTPSAGNADVGKALWLTLRCVHCHGEDANGIPGIAPSPVQRNLTFFEFAEQVHTGGNGMPAFGAGEIPDAYLLHLWTYLVNTNSNGE